MRRSSRVRSAPIRFEDSTSTVVVPSRSSTVDKNYYDCSVLEVDKKNQKVLVSWNGYPESENSWLPFTDDVFPVVKRVAVGFSPTEDTLAVRREKFVSLLRLDVLRHLKMDRKTDPLVRIEIATERDVFDSLFSAMPATTVRGVRQHSLANRALDHVLGKMWHVRVSNINGDCCFIHDNSIVIWYLQPSPIIDYTRIGNKFFRKLHEQHAKFVMKFVKREGNRGIYDDMLKNSL